jgi:hypothetical protein
MANPVALQNEKARFLLGKRAFVHRDKTDVSTRVTW